MVYVTFALTVGLPIGLGITALCVAHYRDQRREREYWERVTRIQYPNL